MSEIGVQRFAAGHRQKHKSERDQADVAMVGQETHAVEWIGRQQHVRIVVDIHQPGNGDGDEPNHHDRPEEGGDPGCAAALHGKQNDQNGNREPDDIMLEGGRREFQPFHRRQNGNRRRDHRIAEEHRGADDAENVDRGGAAAERPARQRGERQRAALAVVVGAQQDQDIFAGHDNDQRPQDERQHAEHRVAADGAGGARRHHRLAQGIERAGADVAEHHADGTERQRQEAGGGATHGLRTGHRRQRWSAVGRGTAHGVIARRYDRRTAGRSGAFIALPAHRQYGRVFKASNPAEPAAPRASR